MENKPMTTENDNMVQLPDDLEKEVCDLSARTGFTIGEVIHYGITLLEIIYRARKDGQTVLCARGKEYTTICVPWPESHIPQIQDRDP